MSGLGFVVHAQPRCNPLQPAVSETACRITVDRLGGVHRDDAPVAAVDRDAAGCGSGLRTVGHGTRRPPVCAWQFRQCAEPALRRTAHGICSVAARW